MDRLRTISTRSGSRDLNKDENQPADANKDENEVAADDAVLYTLPVRQALIKIQAHARGFAARKEYHCLWYDTTKAATLMQTHVRGWKARRRFVRMLNEAESAVSVEVEQLEKEALPEPQEPAELQEPADAPASASSAWDAVNR